MIISTCTEDYSRLEILWKYEKNMDYHWGRNNNWVSNTRPYIDCMFNSRNVVNTELKERLL